MIYTALTHYANLFEIFNVVIVIISYDYTPKGYSHEYNICLRETVKEYHYLYLINSLTKRGMISNSK